MKTAIDKVKASKAKLKRQRDNWKRKARIYQLALLCVIGSPYVSKSDMEMCEAAIREGMK